MRRKQERRRSCAVYPVDVCPRLQRYIVACLFTAGSVLELLDTSNLELRILSTAIAANVLAFSDSLLLTNEECIDGFYDCMEVLLDAIKR